MASNLLTAFATLELKGASAVNRELQGVEAQAARTEKSLSQRVGGSLKSLGGGMQAAGKQMSMFVTLPLAAAGAGALAAANSVDKAMATIRAGTGATGSDLEKLRGNFENVFKQVPQGADEVSQAMADLNTRTGQSGKGLEELTKNMLDLARVSGEEVEPLTASVTRVFGDWSIATEDQAESMDYLWKVSQTTGIGVNELSETVVSFGAPLRQMGFDFETSAAMLGKWEQEGVNIGTVLAGMKIGLGKISAEGGEPAKVLADVSEQIKNAGSQGEANALAIETFGQRAGPDMAAAIREGRFDLDELMKTLKDSPETIGAAAKETMTLGDRMGILRNKVTLAAEPFGHVMLDALESIMPYLERGLNAVTRLGEWFGKLPGPVQAAAVGVLALVAALGPLLMVAGMVVSAIGSLVLMFGAGGLGLTLGAVLAPIAAVVAALVGLAALGLLVYRNFDRLKTVFSPVVAVFQAFANVVRNALATALRPVSNWFTQNLPLMKRTAQTVLSFISGYFRMHFNLIRTIVTTVMRIIRAIWKHGNDEMLAIARTVWRLISRTIDTFIRVIGNFIKLGMQIITGDWRGAWETIKRIAQIIWSAIRDLIVSIWRKMADAVTYIREKMQAGIRRGFEWIRDFSVDIFNRVRDGIISRWEAIRDKVREIRESLQAGIRKGFEWIRDFSGRVWEEVSNRIVGAFSKGINKAREWLGGLMIAVGNVLSALGMGDLADAAKSRGAKLQRPLEFARGGVYNADRGGIAGPGRMGIVGEAGDDEAIVNLSRRTKESQEAFRRALRSPNATVEDDDGGLPHPPGFRRTAYAPLRKTTAGRSDRYVGWDAVDDARGTASFDISGTKFGNSYSRAAGVWNGPISVSTGGGARIHDIHSERDAPAWAMEHEDGSAAIYNNLRFLDSYGASHLDAVAVHEVGHLLGLNHGIPTPSVMNYGSTYRVGATPQSNDWAALNELWGTAGKGQGVPSEYLGRTDDTGAGAGIYGPTDNSLWSPDVFGRVLEVLKRFRVAANTYTNHPPDPARSADFWDYDGGRGSAISRELNDKVRNFVTSKLSTGLSYILGEGDDFVHSGSNRHVHVTWGGSDPNVPDVPFRSIGGQDSGGFDWMGAITSGLAKVPGFPDIGLGVLGEGMGKFAKGLLGKAKDWLIEKAKAKFGATLAGTGKYTGGGNLKEWATSGLHYGDAFEPTPGNVRKIMDLAMKESTGNPNAQNASGASGLMQMMPGTFNAYRRLPGDDIFNPVHNVGASSRYQLDEYGGLVTHSPYSEGGVAIGPQLMALAEDAGKELVLPLKGKGAQIARDALQIDELRNELRSTRKTLNDTLVRQEKKMATVEQWARAHVGATKRTISSGAADPEIDHILSEAFGD